jgi:hypothetical protein
MKRMKGEAAFVILGCLAIWGICVLLFWGLPVWNVWRAGLSGGAELRRAEQNRQITIQEAKAKLESAKYLNEAEVIRARGVAESNKIVADGLGGPEGYLRYLWIQQVSGQPGVIYVPTEAGMPILEAGKRP